MIKKDFTPYRGYFADDIIKVRLISQMHIINLSMKTIHNISHANQTAHGVLLGIYDQKIGHQKTDAAEVTERKVQPHGFDRKPAALPIRSK
jgi:hypothetical protein